MKSYPASFKYLLSLTPGLLVIAGNLLGGYYSAMGALYTMGLLIGIEKFFTKENKSGIPFTDGVVPNTILFMHIIMHTLSIGTLLFSVHSGILTDSFLLLAVLSTGISSGIEGINSAHEMIHRKQKAWQLAGIWNLLLVCYGHFYIEHIYNHHKHVGTVKDPATARFGESFYSFFFRTVPQQFLSALTIEHKRVSEKRQWGYGTGNFVVMITMLQLFMAAVIFFTMGKAATLAFLLQSFIAFFLLEYVNYIEHYGLIRVEKEKVNVSHSWQSDMPISRFALIELSRHSDHHITASKPYYTLASHAGSPVLPSGYFGSFYYALIPPLWYKMVHPVLEKYQKEIMKTGSATKKE